MEEGAASHEPLGKVVPLRVAAQPSPPLEQLVEQTFSIAIGLSALASEVLAEAVARTLGREPFAEGEGPGSDQTSRPASGMPLVAGATLGVALEAGRWGARAATTMYRSAELFFSLVTSPSFVQEPLREAGSRLGVLDAKWREQRPRDERAGAAFLRLLIPQAVDAALDQIDLNELVAKRVDVGQIIERVDLDRAIAGMDLDAVVNGLDIDRILERIDLEAVVARVPVDEIVSRLDIDAIVARVDLDQVVGRVDIQAVADKLDLQEIVRRLDLTSIASEVIEEVNLTRIIQEAVGSMTTETVGGIRVQSMNADRAISRVVERLLRRTTDDSPSSGPPDLVTDEPRKPR